VSFTSLLCVLELFGVNVLRAPEGLPKDKNRLAWAQHAPGSNPRASTTLRHMAMVADRF